MILLLMADPLIELHVLKHILIELIQFWLAAQNVNMSNYVDPSFKENIKYVY